MKFIPVIALLLCGSVHAQKLEDVVKGVGIHLTSRHDPNHGENQFNPGFYARLPYGIVVGNYTNSYAKPTNYVGWATPEFSRMRVSFLMATGYTKKNYVAVPLPSVKLYQFDEGMQVWLTGFPVQITDSRAIGHISLEWNFK